jgi:hypothetical protein
MQKIVASSRCFVFFYDEVTMIDNQSWISIHCYVVQDWCHLLVLIFLEQIIERGGSNNLTKVNMDALRKHAGVSNTNVVSKLLSFGTDGINVF